VEGRTWEERVFSNTVIIGNPVTASDRAVKVVLAEPQIPKMDKSIQRICRDRFPELADATKTSKSSSRSLGFAQEGSKSWRGKWWSRLHKTRATKISITVKLIFFKFLNPTRSLRNN
jgi:hypothetical protein